MASIHPRSRLKTWLRVPMMTKAEAQDEWDAIVTVPDLSRERAEQILAEQQWFSYTPSDQQIFSSGGSSGVRGVYVWDWHFFVSAACLAWRMQAREERREPHSRRRGLPFCRRARRRMPARRCSMCRPSPAMETVVIPAGAPIDEIIASVAAARTHPPRRLRDRDRATRPRSLAGRL